MQWYIIQNLLIYTIWTDFSLSNTSKTNKILYVRNDAIGIVLEELSKIFSASVVIKNLCVKCVI